MLREPGAEARGLGRLVQAVSVRLATPPATNASTTTLAWFLAAYLHISRLSLSGIGRLDLTHLTALNQLARLSFVDCSFARPWRSAPPFRFRTTPSPRTRTAYHGRSPVHAWRCWT